MTMSAFGKTLHDARDGYEQLREKSLHARDATRTYIHDEPIKSMLIAAAVGVALIGLVALFSELSDRRD
jgi:ElaB/YqjD/DUF883 family membrane-anchored ribosome-binding protein